MQILIEYEGAIPNKPNTNDNIDSFHNAVGPGFSFTQLIFMKTRIPR